ncbi:ABC transporter substrate-binding protein [Acidisoma silvae]|uniref:ABC transporter substrate-binding protein n=1 Tax=Acidisoma silvae TaxID=2802396 RepID=A0A964DYA9_9PROT|nr:ABC transporter substrate-binding protein [Acidisoma silvae]MCB8874799.1 ABC transporter substrate-binding protein [Acidisoma silvae]
MRSAVALKSFASLAIGLAVSLGAHASLAQAASLTPLKFVYDWPVADFDMVPIVVGQEQGIYAKHGLDVSVLFPPDAQTTARMLATNRADIGFEATTDLVFAANQGIPVTAIANFTQTNSWCLIARPGDTIDVTKLKGKSIGVFTDSWTKAMMGFVLKKAGLQESDVKEIIATDDDMPMLLSKKIDIATNAAAYGLAEVEDGAHEKPVMACNDAIGVPNIPVWVFTGSPDWLKANAQTTKTWLAATAEAIDWSIAHPTEAAKIFTKAYPAAGSENYNVIGWTYTAALMMGPDGYFKQNDQQWTVLAQALKDIGQISEVKAPSFYYTNDYLP